MRIQQNVIKRLTPWLVSGAAGGYIVARVRQLSQTEAYPTTWPGFLCEQSDVLLMLFGGSFVWHRSRQNQNLPQPDQPLLKPILNDGIVHQLRQVLTILLLGLGMILRKASQSKDVELAALAQRLQGAARTGAGLLFALNAANESALEEDLYFPLQNGK